MNLKYETETGGVSKKTGWASTQRTTIRTKTKVVYNNFFNSTAIIRCDLPYGFKMEKLNKS